MALWSMQVEHRLIVRYAVSHRLCAFRIALAARARVWVCIAITLLRFRCKKLLKTFSFSFKGFEDYLYLYGKPLFGWAGWAVCVFLHHHCWLCSLLAAHIHILPMFFIAWHCVCFVSSHNVNDCSAASSTWSTCTSCGDWRALISCLPLQ